jgi:hypothetical protein
MARGLSRLPSPVPVLSTKYSLAGLRLVLVMVYNGLLASALCNNCHNLDPIPSFWIQNTVTTRLGVLQLLQSRGLGSSTAGALGFAT